MVSTNPSINKDFNEFVIKRCEAALMENRSYMDKEQSNEIDPDELHAMAMLLGKI